VKARKHAVAALVGAGLLGGADRFCAGPSAGNAEASIVERVVAIVGERPILLSELRHRARPHQYRIMVSIPDPARQTAAETEMFRELLNRMIDDRLEEQAADKAHLAVTPEEVDGALKNVAAGAKISVRDLIGEARKQGLTEQDYRDEIRRQILEGKLVNLRVRGRVRVTEQDARASYGHWLKEVDQQQQVEVRILALRILPGTSQVDINARVTLALDLAMQTRGGKDFCELVKNYSEDATTKDTCGSRGPQPFQLLVPELQQAVQALKPGEVSDPIRIGDQAVLLLQLQQAPKIPTFEQVKDQMTERAFGEAMERQRKQWLLELRRGVYIDVRL
jgi:peptidyl-prolyl cis-trans isomerase SurA